jgi:hypothetical protein
MTHVKDPRLKFLANCDRSKGPLHCWPWTAGCFNDGYGQVRVYGRPTRAHRLAWELYRGVIPDGLMVCHTCDNHRCVNPRHLFLGTAQDNMDDMKRKGRDRRRYMDGGGKHHTKLTAADVVEIRKLHRSGIPAFRIAELFGVGAIHVRDIVAGRRWSCVKEG